MAKLINRNGIDIESMSAPLTEAQSLEKMYSRQQKNRLINVHTARKVYRAELDKQRPTGAAGRHFDLLIELRANLPKDFKNRSLTALAQAYDGWVMHNRQQHKEYQIERRNMPADEQIDGWNGWPAPDQLTFNEFKQTNPTPQEATEFTKNVMQIVYAWLFPVKTSARKTSYWIQARAALMSDDEVRQYCKTHRIEDRDDSATAKLALSITEMRHFDKINRETFLKNKSYLPADYVATPPAGYESWAQFKQETDAIVATHAERQAAWRQAWDKEQAQELDDQVSTDDDTPAQVETENDVEPDNNFADLIDPLTLLIEEDN
ncbi:hypothetical protein [Allopusillimonas ginsengisoli]|uniref:hypothetical protein n=1 Tax=Allopusillimonas ginsengisoli TaxID=453575 RepID=UPI00101EC7F6|nr:hypothetical protein [Allopusillimonas ginsengisoli]TEA79485.1 hypothetical protein ERE07_00545 [Allopusillimonas ginsengisoli]